MTMQRYFYLKQRGQILGPFEAAKLLQMYRSGLLTGVDQISPNKIYWHSVAAFFGTATAASSGTISLSEPRSTTIQLQPEDVMPQEEAPVETEPAEESETSSSGRFWKIAVALFLLVLLAGGGLWLFQQSGTEEGSGKQKQEQEQDGSGTEAGQKGNVAGEQPPASGDEAKPANWQAIIQQNQAAIGVVLLEVTGKNGKKEFFPQGTAWANSENTFVTNAHVAATFAGCLNLSGIRSVKGYVAMNGGTQRHLIHALQVHPGYTEDSSDSDFAVLHTKDILTTYLKCGEESELRKLQQGDEVISLGFPMEGLDRGNLNLECPTATMHKGTIAAISDSTYADRGFAKNTLIRHSLPAVGGASGSPIFATSGHVVAILFAGNMNFEFDSNGKMRKREASAAMINFAIRIDRLQQCLEAEIVPVETFMRGKKQ